MLRSWILTAVLSFAVAASAADDVFLDEGEGDFDSIPTVPAHQKTKSSGDAPKEPAKKNESKKAASKKSDKKKNKKEATAKPAKKQAEERDLASDEETIAEAPVPVSEAAPDARLDVTASAMEQLESAPQTDDLPQVYVSDSVPEAATEAAPDSAEKPAKNKKAAKAKSTKAAKTEKKKTAGGIYVVTKDACTMTREPASESDSMLTVKASKKIWVEEVDENWVRGFNKAGEPGYISRECVQ